MLLLHHRLINIVNDFFVLTNKRGADQQLFGAAADRALRIVLFDAQDVLCNAQCLMSERSSSRRRQGFFEACDAPPVLPYHQAISPSESYRLLNNGIYELSITDVASASSVSEQGLSLFVLKA